jgi:hypothetical protein
MDCFGLHASLIEDPERGVGDTHDLCGITQQACWRSIELVPTRMRGRWRRPRRGLDGTLTKPRVSSGHGERPSPYVRCSSRRVMQDLPDLQP